MKPELLLPVGDMSMALAAIHNGADAIYVGVPGFNARGRTKDFSRQELKELIDLCHLYGVKVHLAFNVLVFENELEDAAQVLEDILPLGPDALIVQDLGLVRLIRAMAPDQRIHGSTQMTVTNDEAIKLVDDLNIQRFVLGRENSLPEIQIIREHTTRELEVFVHGALCVAYSGQCFTSESLGGRSANRGQCAQSCRLDYELWVDGEKQDLGAKKYLVSPQDLCGIDEIPQLMKIGVDSFKVEGRLKTPEYVATAARSYQNAIAGETVDKKNMAISFGRGFFNGWLGGVDHQRLVEGTFSSHRGHEIGKVLKVSIDAIWIEDGEVPVAGQGLMFSHEKGGKVISAEKTPEGIRVRLLSPFAHSEVPAGSRTWINSDDRIAKETRLSMEDRQHMKRVPIAVELTLEMGKAAVLIVTDAEGRTVIVNGEACVAATNAATNEDSVKAELGALGTTAFKLASLKLNNSDVYISQKQLKALRRSMVEAMTESRLRRQTVLEIPNALDTLRPTTINAEEAKLNVILRSKGQVEDLVARMRPHAQLGVVILDFEFGKDYASSVALLREHGFTSGIATTRILKPREYYNLNIIERAKPDAILVRNLGALQWFQGKDFRLIGDFSLNASNSVTVDYLLSKGLESVCASYDLNQSQLEALLANSPRNKVEVTLHQYMPEFHMEHCVFAAFMSKGSSFRDCGKPCEKHQVELKDAYGHMHFLKADQECRNTLYRGSAQSAAFLVGRTASPGIWRFEALNERGDVLIAKLDAYLGLVAGEVSLADAVKQVGTSEKYGVTEGQLAHAHAWKDRKKELLT